MNVSHRSIIYGAAITALLMTAQAGAQTTPASTPNPAPATQPPARTPQAPSRNMSTPAPATTKPDCSQKTGVEKAECQRRDAADDAAPAGVTQSMKEKKDAQAKEEAVPTKK